MFKFNNSIARTFYFAIYISWPDKLYFYVLFNLENFDSYDHYAACCFPLRKGPCRVSHIFSHMLIWVIGD